MFSYVIYLLTNSQAQQIVKANRYLKTNSDDIIRIQKNSDDMIRTVTSWTLYSNFYLFSFLSTNQNSVYASLSTTENKEL